jgi:hypothetical protein
MRYIIGGVAGENLAGLDDDDIFGAVHFLGGMVTVVLSFLHLASAWKQRLIYSESVTSYVQGGVSAVRGIRVVRASHSVLELTPPGGPGSLIRACAAVPSCDLEIGQLDHVPGKSHCFLNLIRAEPGKLCSS